MSGREMLQGSGSMNTESTANQEKKFLGRTRKFWLKLCLLLLFIGVILIAIFVFKLHKKLDDILEWIRDHKAPGFFIFAGTYMLLTALLIPGSILSIGAGFVFGWYLGTLAVLLGATAGQTIAFLEGRYFFREWIATKTQSMQTWQAIEGAVEHEGWKIVGLLRLAPLAPYNVLNPALGLTSVKFWHYTIASAIGIIPGTILYVYLGSAAKDFSEITSRKAGTLETVLVAIATGVFIILAVVLITYYAKRAIRKRLQIVEEGDGNATGEDATGDDATGDDAPKEDIENPNVVKVIEATDVDYTSEDVVKT